jgi:hypothetical protein
VKRKIKGGLTSVSLPIFVADTSSTTGGGLSGVTSASSGLVMEYRRQNQSTWTSVTPQAGKTLGTYFSGGIVADGSLDGAYEVDFPDAAFASGARMVVCRVRGVADMLPVLIEIELDAVDYQDAAAFGLSRLDATIGSRSTLTAGGVRTELATELGRIDATVGSRATPTNITSATGVTLTPVTGLGNQTADITGNLSGSVGSVTGSVGSVTSFGSLVSDIATAVWGAATRTLTAFGFNVNLTPSTGLGSQNGSVATVNTVLELGQSALSANGADAEVTAAVWDAQYSAHTAAGSFGKLMDILRKANTVVEGTVTSAATPTATSFSSNVNYPTGAFKHAVLVFVNSAAIDEQNSPILGYVNTNGVFTVEEPFTVAPTVGDEFIVIPTTHVHSVEAIVAGVLGQATSTSAYDAGDVGYVLRQLFSMIESDGSGGWQYTADALDQAPAGGGGGGGTDWNANERTAFRTILGFNSSGDILDPSSGILDTIRGQTALITSGGTVYVTSPVTATGQLASPLIIGDDYLAANGRRFRWTVELPSGYAIATSTARFGMRYEDEQGVNSFIKTGTVSDAGSGNVYLDFDLTKEVETGLLRPGWYEWSVEIVSGSGVEVTRVKSGKNVEWQEKQT